MSLARIQHLIDEGLRVEAGSMDPQVQKILGELQMWDYRTLFSHWAAHFKSVLRLYGLSKYIEEDFPPPGKAHVECNEADTQRSRDIYSLLVTRVPLEAAWRLSVFENTHDPARKAWKCLKSVYLSEDVGFILYKELFVFQLSAGETLADYLNRAEALEFELQARENAVSPAVLLGSILNGLPTTRLFESANMMIRMRQMPLEKALTYLRRVGDSEWRDGVSSRLTHVSQTSFRVEKLCSSQACF